MTSVVTEDDSTIIANKEKTGDMRRASVLLSTADILEH